MSYRISLIRILILAGLALFNVGCTTLATYEVDEAELEQYLAKAVKDFDRQQARSGSPLSVELHNASIDLGPDDRDVIVLDVQGQAALNAVIAKIPVDMDLKIEGAPVYSGKDKAVYIKRLRLVDSKMTSPYLQGNAQQQIKPVADMVLATLAKVLEDTPIYRLDESDPRQRLLANMPVDIVVGRGKLRIVPQQ